MVQIELTQEDLWFLREQLARRVEATQNELVHTDDRALRADISRDLERIQRLADRVAQAAQPRSA